MNKVLFLFILFFYCSVCSASGLNEKFIYSTVLIYVYQEGGLGTGFFCFNKSSDGKTSIFLVTNKHVLPKKGKNKEITIKINKVKSENILVDTIDIPITGNDNEYFPYVKLHKDEDVDIAVINVSEFIRNHNIIGTWLGLDLLATKEILKKEEVNIGTEVYVLGYPKLIFDEKNTFPVLRQGVIATVPSAGYAFNEILRNKYKDLPKYLFGFLIDANIFPGSSGSMVILKPPPQVIGFRGAYTGKGPSGIPYVLGIVANSIPIYDDALNSTQRMGVGVVISADKIRESIEMFNK